MRSLVLLVALLGCVESNVVQCGDGRVCPAGAACDILHESCVKPEQLESCVPMNDGDACDIDKVGDGICDQQVCIVARCGDGYQRGDEACDGNDIPADVTCQSLGFYVQGAVACNDACGIDDSMCLGLCGDGQVDPEHEVCEPTIDPVLTCVDFGYGAGVLGCNMCAPGLEQCRRFGWDTTTLSFSPEGISGTADDNVFVVGNAGVEYFDGKSWTDVDLGGCFAAASVPPLRRVTVIGDREALVTSNAGVVVHLTSAGCTKLPNVPGDPNLGEIWASSPTDVYAIESQNVWHYDGSSWTSALQGFYVDVMGTGPNDVYVADGGAAQILHYTGTWQAPLAVPNMTIVNAFWGTGSDLYVAGQNTSSDAYIAHYDGAVWTTSFADNDRIAPGSTMVVYGAGSGSTSVATGFYYNNEPRPFLIHGDGTSYTNIGSPTPTFAAVWVSPNGTIYAVDDDTDYVSVLAQIRFDARGGANEGLGQRLGGAQADELFAGGVNALGASTFKWNGFAWSKDTNIGASMTVGVGPAGQVYGISRGSTGLYQYNRTTGVWGLFGSSGVSGEAIAVAGTADVWFVSGGQLSRRVTNGSTTTTPYPFVGASVSDVWASGPNDVFAVGTGGMIQHWTGSSWAPMASGTTVDLLGIEGDSNSDLYAWGDSTLLRYNGTAWSAMTLPPNVSPVRAWAGSPSDLFVITRSRGIWRFDGSRWADVNIGTSVPLYDIIGLGESLFVSDEVGGVHQLIRAQNWN